MSDKTSPLNVTYGLNGALSKMIKRGGFARGVFASRGLMVRDSTYGVLTTPASVLRQFLLGMVPLTAPSLYTRSVGATVATDALAAGNGLYAPAAMTAGGITYVSGLAFPNLAGTGLPGSAVGDIVYGAVIDLTINQNQALGSFGVSFLGNPIGGSIVATGGAGVTTQSNVPGVALRAVFDPPNAIGRYRIWLLPAVAARNSGFAYTPAHIRGPIGLGAVGTVQAAYANSGVVIGFEGGLVAAGAGGAAQVGISVTLLTHGSIELDSLLSAYNRHITMKMGLPTKPC